jgi:hypothetical protein
MGQDWVKMLKVVKYLQVISRILLLFLQFMGIDYSISFKVFLKVLWGGIVCQNDSRR